MEILKATMLADGLLASDRGEMPPCSWRMQEDSAIIRNLVEGVIRPTIEAGRNPLDVLALVEKAMLSFLLCRPGATLDNIAAALEMSDTGELIALAARYGFRPQVG